MKNRSSSLFFTPGLKYKCDLFSTLYTYDGFGRKIRVDYSQVPDGMIVGHQSIYTDDWYQLTSTREYVGPHVFCDGRLEYSAFPGGYFDPDKGAMYYITDWQGNNAAVVDKNGTVAQQTIYYPYGEPTIEPEGQRYLFGGKEREHAGGRNAYDFGARCLTPYGRWSVVDPLAEKSYQTSPYSMCAGDPINFIDPDGRWIVYLGSDKKLNDRARHLPADDKIHVIAHGNPSSIYYDIKNPEEPIEIKSGKRLKNAILKNLFDSKRILERSGIEIILHSCNTGVTPEDNSEPLGKKLSKELPNAIIIAPNGMLKIDSKGRQTVYDIKGEKERDPKDYWRVFFRGLELPFSYIERIKEYLQTLEQLKLKNNENKDDKDEDNNSK